MNKRQRQKQRGDSLINVVSGLNSNRDPSVYNKIFKSLFVTAETADALFSSNGIFKKIITAPVDEALRAGFEIVEGDNPCECNDNVQGILEDMGMESAVAEAMYWHRCYGGGVIMPIFDGGGDIGEELDVNAMRSIQELRVFSMREVTPAERNINPEDMDYNKPITYTINDESNGSSFTVHKSRLIIFPGDIVPNRLRNERNGWGGMVIEEIYDALINKYDCGNSYSVKLLERFSQGVLKIEGMIDLCSSNPDMLKKYLNQIDLTRNVLNTLAIDGKDDFDLKNMTLTGVQGLLEHYQTDVSSVSKMPVTILYGRSPAGQNATGDSDFEQYHAFVGQLQRRDIKPGLRQLVEYVAMCKDYHIALPEHWSIKFCPLSIPSEKEQAETNSADALAENNRANARKTYASIGALDIPAIQEKLEEEGYTIDHSLDAAANDPPPESGDVT